MSMNSKRLRPPPLPPHPWSRKLKRARKEQHLSQREAARRSGLAVGVIIKLENGHGSVDSFERVCEALGVDPADIASRNSA